MHLFHVRQEKVRVNQSATLLSYLVETSLKPGMNLTLSQHVSVIYCVLSAFETKLTASDQDMGCTKERTVGGRYC